MKKFLFIALFFTNHLMASERILISDSKVSDVTINNTSIRCSALGYGMAELKINIPALDGWTVFDHSNINAGDFGGQPCMTAGACRRNAKTGGFSIDDILGVPSQERVETVKVNRKLVEVKELSKDESGNDICVRHIEERLLANVNRGDGNGVIRFTHLRSGLIENFPVSVCQ
jgi:hypothetical protein